MCDLRVRVRDGCRGGREQFKWNSVQDQDFKDREQYLGQSTKVGTMGKFGRYYLHDWYANKRDSADRIEEEKDSVKAYEEELMQEALGLKPKKLLLAKKQLTEEEIKEFLAPQKKEGKRGRDQMGPQKKLVTNEHGHQVEEEDIVTKAYVDGAEKGLGFAAHRNAKLEAYKNEVMGSESKLEGGEEQGLIKVEDDDVKFLLGVKKQVKADQAKLKAEQSEIKQEIKQEKQEPASSSSAAGIKDGGQPKADDAVKEEADDVKEEVEGDGPSRKKAKQEQADDGSDTEKKRKKSDKDKKDAKKLKKKEKKAAKKVKKLAKKEKKAAKKAKKAAAAAKKKSSSSSSDSSS
eukprot:TRINITY_DN105567_c0_g1_i1.p1 TRINITY_DN105567_c0_g1~~TRINITY_DN105567_c0_g1_i1.p1  ORF type:complete len:347 (+),score=161.93 TRINITY_DN105567_c0_g1_i1:102-1142(+)